MSDFEKGRKAGQAWARNKAFPSDLLHLEEFRVLITELLYPGSDFGEWFQGKPAGPYCHAEGIAMTILDYNANHHDARKIRQTAKLIFGKQYASKTPEYIHGFMEGAIELLHDGQAREAEARFG